ncbi:hypothetical protein L2E82_37468 [Cichorium intybus]|uniref:Uncharacterized protein n=1 Tax=Cichorium intybus TaxID=13427 RepID=A0ACB9AEY3_CICIN|nr:hypothetical protein L2E82_37468 [Cichorium intybus]
MELGSRLHFRVVVPILPKTSPTHKTIIRCYASLCQFLDRHLFPLHCSSKNGAIESIVCRSDELGRIQMLNMLQQVCSIDLSQVLLIICAT